MSGVVYVSNVRIVQQFGPVRVAQLPGEPEPIIFSAHGDLARHYGLDPDVLKESHAATIDYVIAALGG
jgi:hypothetical protein